MAGFWGLQVHVILYCHFIIVLALEDDVHIEQSLDDGVFHELLPRIVRVYVQPTPGVQLRELLQGIEDHIVDLTCVKQVA